MTQCITLCVFPFDMSTNACSWPGNLNMFNPITGALRISRMTLALLFATNCAFQKTLQTNSPFTKRVSTLGQAPEDLKQNFRPRWKLDIHHKSSGFHDSLFQLVQYTLETRMPGFNDKANLQNAAKKKRHWKHSLALSAKCCYGICGWNSAFDNTFKE